MPQTMPFDRSTLKTISSGSIAEGIVGTGAVAVAVIGLAGIFPLTMLAVATIAVGAALLLQGGAVAARFNRLIHAAGENNRVDISELGGGMSAEFIGGVGGVILGILALMDVLPNVVIPIAAIVYGATLIIGSGVNARINALTIDFYDERDTVRKVAREAVNATSGVQLLIGIGSITLGILALIGMNPLVLSLVALLSLGASDLLSGTAIGARLTSILER